MFKQLFDFNQYKVARSNFEHGIRSMLFPRQIATTSNRQARLHNEQQRMVQKLHIFRYLCGIFDIFITLIIAISFNVFPLYIG